MILIKFFGIIILFFVLLAVFTIASLVFRVWFTAKQLMKKSGQGGGQWQSADTYGRYTGRQSTSQQQSASQQSGGQTISGETKPRNSAFDKDEGEYVEFEEL